MTVSGINMVFRIVHSRYSVRKWPHISIHGYAFEMMWVITTFGYLIRCSKFGLNLNRTMSSDIKSVGHKRDHRTFNPWLKKLVEVPTSEMSQ